MGELTSTPPSGGARGRWRRRGDLWLLVLACAVGTAVAIAVASFARPERRVAHAPGLRGPAPAAQDAGRAAPAFRMRGAHGEPQDSRYPNDTHSAVLWLADRGGRLRVQYEARQPVDAADLAHDLSVLLAEPPAPR